MPRVLFFDFDGGKARQITAKISGITWALNNVTEGTFEINPAEFGQELFVNADLIRPAGLVLVQSDFMTEWAGVVYFPQEIGQTVKITAKSLLHLLRGRLVSERIAKRKTAGEAVMEAIRQTKQEHYFPIISKKKFIGTGGPPLLERIDPGEKILDMMEDMGGKRGFEFRLDPIFRGSKLKGRLHFRRRIMEFGNDPIQIGPLGNAVWDGSHPYIRTGKLITRYHVVGSETRKQLRGKTTSEESFNLGKYGLWEEVIERDSLNSGKIENKGLRKLLRASNKPIERWKIKIPLGDLSESMKPGTVHELFGPGAGISEGEIGTRRIVRVVAMAYNDNDGAVSAVLERVHRKQRND